VVEGIRSAERFALSRAADRGMRGMPDERRRDGETEQTGFR
jgi:hypothetical protein